MLPVVIGAFAVVTSALWEWKGKIQDVRFLFFTDTNSKEKVSQF